MRHAWDRAVRIAGLRALLTTVTAVRDLPDDDPHVAALVDVLGVIADNRNTDRPPNTAAASPPAIEPGDTAIQLFERHIRDGLTRLQDQPAPRPVQWLADRYIAAKTARQARAQKARPVPPNIDGQVAEIRQQLRRRP